MMDMDMGCTPFHPLVHHNFIISTDICYNHKLAHTPGQNYLEMGSKMVNKLQLTPHGWMASDPKSATKWPPATNHPDGSPTFWPPVVFPSWKIPHKSGMSNWYVWLMEGNHNPPVDWWCSYVSHSKSQKSLVIFVAQKGWSKLGHPWWYLDGFPIQNDHFLMPWCPENSVAIGVPSICGLETQLHT